MRQDIKDGQKSADVPRTSTSFPRHSDWVKGGAGSPLIVVVEAKDFKAASDWVNSRQPPSYAMPAPSVAAPSIAPPSPSSADVTPARSAEFKTLHGNLYMKKCTRCGAMKPETREHFGSTPSGNLKGYCRTCMNNYSRKYEENNKEGRRQRDEKRARTDNNARSSFSIDIKRRLYEIQEGLCICCNKKLDNIINSEVDHRIPLARGGKHAESNFLLAHARCNREKHNKTLVEHWEWRVQVGLDAKNLGTIKRLKKWTETSTAFPSPAGSERPASDDNMMESALHMMFLNSPKADSTDVHGGFLSPGMTQGDTKDQILSTRTQAQSDASVKKIVDVREKNKKSEGVGKRLNSALLDSLHNQNLSHEKVSPDTNAAFLGDDQNPAFWMSLAIQGDAQAQNNLGRMYAEGLGVPQYYAEAMKWLRLAADQGYAPAQSALGFMYGNGRGVPQDSAQAVKWYQLAADQGYAKAQYNLAVSYFTGRGVPQDYAQAVKWAQRAADQGYAMAQSRLGVIRALAQAFRRANLRQ